MIVPFERADAPAHHAGHPIRHVAAWYSWTEAARRLLAEWRQAGGDPALVHLRDGIPYDSTFSLAGHDFDARLRAATCELAVGFLSIPKSEEIILLRDVLLADDDSAALHRMLACLRDCISAILEDDFAALYAPLGTTGVRAGAFPLHADLYQPDMLLNIFDLVPDGEDGASIFLSAAELDEVLSGLKSMPDDVRKHAQWCLSAPITSDRYEEFYSLLHNPNSAWNKDLNDEFGRRQMKIRFCRGEGYLIHDRTWLHGRTAPHLGVDLRRLYRLVFRTVSRQGRTIIQ